jgi:prepilin peptidase CpaA
MIPTNATLALALLFTAVAAGFDLRTGHIPNFVTFGAMVAGGVLHVVMLCRYEPALQPLDASQLALAVTHVAFGILACGLAPYLLFLRGGMGGGDVKLLAGVGASLGPLLGLEIELYAFVAMALFACTRLAYEGRLLHVLAHSAALLVNPLLPRARRRAVSPALLCWLKFGPAVFAATAAVALLRFRAG